MAAALTQAAAAGAWGAVAELARSIEARQKARSGVVELDAARRRREK